MSDFTVGYFVGNLATNSINRKLAKALVRLSPAELRLQELPFAIYRSTATTTTPIFLKLQGI
jgi:hypothetical protein